MSDLDGQLLASTFETLQDVSKFLRLRQQNAELRLFHADLKAYCALLCGHWNFVTKTILGPAPSDLILRASELLESIMTPSFVVRGERPASRLHTLNRSWNELPDDISKMEFIQSALDLGSTLQQRNQFIASLSTLEKDIRSSYSQDRQDRDEIASTRNIREPSYAVSTAASSIFKALVACRDCPCRPSHEFCARLCLGTYRNSSATCNGDSDDEDDLSFDMLLSMERYLHEARVRAARAKAVQWDLDSPSQQHSKAKAARPKPKPMKIKRLCEPLAKMRSLNSYRLELKVARDQLFKLQSEKSVRPVDKTRNPISLEQLLREGSRSFTERTRRILAVILSFAVLHLHDTPWLTPVWDSSNVWFFMTPSSAIPLRPFIHAEIAMECDSKASLCAASIQDDSDGSESDDVDPDDLDPDDFIQHQCPALVTLAIMLMEVYFATPFEYLARRYGVDTTEEVGSAAALRYINANVVFKKCKSEIPENSQFHYAVEKCLDPAAWEDEDKRALDNDTLRPKIYQEIVRPLETELSQAYSSIPIENLDQFAQGIDFANWDQPIPTWTSPGSADMSVDSSRHPQPLPGFLSPRSPSPALSLAQRQLPEPRTPLQYPNLHFLGPSHADQGDTLSPINPPVGSGIDYKAFKFFDDETPSEAHTDRARFGYLAWKKRYQDVYGKFIPADQSITPVKIAILDSGVDPSHPDIEARVENIKGKYNWLNDKQTRLVSDKNGHGTFAAGLLLDYAPDAELYIAKIADNKPSEPRIIAKAILHAIDTWQVDVISMPFGFPTSSVSGYPELEAALMTAYSRGVLLFAAASNNGGKLGRSFPAREPTVFAVHSTDADGNRSPFSPTAVPDDCNLATVGEAVESAWPVHFCDDKANPTCIMYKSGTSYATSIMAGIAAFLLTYARVHLPERAAELRSHKRMRALLRRVAEKGTGGGWYKPRDGYYFVDVSLYADNLFGKDKGFIDLTIEDVLNG